MRAIRFLAFSTLALSCGALAGEKRDLILVAGQSNAVGFDATPKELAADETDKQIMFWWRCGDPPPDEFDSSSRDWTTLQPQLRMNPAPKNGASGEMKLPELWRFESGGFSSYSRLAQLHYSSYSLWSDDCVHSYPYEADLPCAGQGWRDLCARALA